MSKDAREDLVLLTGTFVAAAMSATALFTAGRLLAWTAILLADSYLLSVMLFAAILSDNEALGTRHPWIGSFFPSRTAGLFVFTLLFVSIIAGFASLYVGTDVFQSSKTPADAFYLSFFILGFTDYSPKPGYGQFVVISELVSGILYLVGVFPALIARISTFRHP